MLGEPKSWEEHCWEEEKILRRLPVCIVCGERIQSEYMYKIDGWYCEDCKDEWLEESRKNVDDWVEEQSERW